jgi:hypothetical protein
LIYVKEKICLKAVKRDGCSLKYVIEQTEEICLEAVKQDEDALKYVKEQTEEICLEAIKKRMCFVINLFMKHCNLKFL